MTEDAVRWQHPPTPLRIEALAFANLRFSTDPGHPASAKELRRQATALGTFITRPEHAPHFHLLVPGRPRPKAVTYASPPAVESVRCAKRVSPDGHVGVDVVAEITQSCTAMVDGQR